VGFLNTCEHEIYIERCRVYLDLKTIVFGPRMLVAWEPRFQECLQLVALDIATYFRPDHIVVGVSGHLDLLKMKHEVKAKEAGKF